MTGSEWDWIKEDTLVLDTSTHRVGEVQQIGTCYPTSAEATEFAWLRPSGGGVEWSAPLSALEPVGGTQ
ncbi:MULTISPECIES: hypothetical protein [unclassified Streptomyces]|uniref:hypothetical protein n=1 Tax=unclassified Streptomyces TaxID=2593676 RepID=UPI0013CB2FEB|nr:MULTISPECIES: hypothetical protein [unclassified Streptomyces]NEA72478.1 hypothetical protein [Streptomyces sp. SID13588]